MTIELGETEFDGAEFDLGWEPARLLWSLDASVSHLNHGSFGAVPVPVQRAQFRLREEAEANPMKFFARGLRDRVRLTRRHLAKFVGADPEGTAFVPNVTTAVTAILRSLELRAGDEVLITDHAYGAVAIAVRTVCRAAGAVEVIVPVPLVATDADIVELIRARVGPRTRFAVIDQVTSPTARLFPVHALAGALQREGVVVLVDAAHAPGLLEVDVTGLGADFWIGNLHKWACAPRGTALLAVAPRWRSSMLSPVVSWAEQDGFPDSFEQAGTVDLTGWLAAPVAVHTLAAFGWGRLRERNAGLVAWGQDLVGRAMGADPDDLRGDPGVSMRILELPDGIATTQVQAQALQARIAAEIGCEVAVVAWNGRGLLRLSAHAYNQTTDYRRLAAGLPALLRDAART